MKNQLVNGQKMIRVRDLRQPPLIDPWGHLGPKRRQLLENSWAGLFRQEILAELPVTQLARCFRVGFGRPAKELHTVLGVLVLQQMHDLTDAETVNQLAFNQQWHYALDIPSESDAAKYMCPKTLWSRRKQVTDQELDTILFQQVTHKLVRVFAVDTTKQRLDSVHLKSNMRRLGRLGILTRCIHRLLVKLQRHHPELFAALEPELVARYFTKKALACFSQVKPSASEKTLASVAQEGFDLLGRFAGHSQVSGMLSYRLLKRALNDHCEVRSAGAEITVKPAREVSRQSLQNPSDPEAGYSSHKGQGYQAQVMETFCDSEDPKVKARTLNLITHVAVAPASESDSRALLPALADTQARELGPREVLADSAYGGDDNCRQAAALEVEVVAPLPGLPPAPGLSLADFQVSPEGRVLACPQGEAPLSCHYRKHRYRFAFSSEKCSACPEKARCPVKPGKNYHYLRYAEKAGRVAARRAYQQTAEFRDRYRWRAGIEGAMSEYDRRTGVKRLRVRGLRAVRFCATLKAVGVNLFRAAAVRRARSRAGDSSPGSPSCFSWLFSRVKEQISALGAVIIDFLIPDVYYAPVKLPMAA
jgi:Transposase DDE domain/Transposase domain (DUF772)